MKNLKWNSFLVGLLLFAAPYLWSQSPQTAPMPEKAKTQFEFEGTSVKGERTTPMGSILEQATPDQTYDFVTIRGNWQQEMLQSAESLDTPGAKLGLEKD